MTDIARIDFDAVIVNRGKGCRPAGTNDKKKKIYELASLVAKNEIIEIYGRNKRNAGKKRLPRGHLISIICNVKKRNILPDDFLITESCIQQRIKTKAFRVVSSSQVPLSPLHAYEMEFVQVIIQMTKMKDPLSLSESMHLINSMIAGIQAQTYLLTFKSKIHLEKTEVLVYCNGFKN